MRTPVRTRSGASVMPVVRGVLGNVAYALYFPRSGRGSAGATADVVKRLDAALFEAFPRSVREAHAR